ncbi:MAG: T9SS type A sorting domain-containing protein [Bacteroidota bacterium]|nr:T9SS type A sorting domain-containing protein [Bacteroidota bacterium]
MKKIILSFIFFILSDLSINAQCWKLSAGKENCTFAIRTDSTLWVWGNNTYGQFGNGGTTSQSTPLKIGTENKWQSIAVGGVQSVAVKTDGTLWAWGGNGNGELGDGTYINRDSPIQIGSATNWKSVAAGEAHSLALKTDGTLWAWGYGADGQLGTGIFTAPTINTPTMVGTSNNWQSIAAGRFYTFAIKTNGTLWGWGSNTSGQLGDGTTSNINDTPIQTGTDTDWQSVACAWGTTFAIKMDGTLWGWGQGYIGNGSITSELSPVQIGTANNWQAVATAQFHFMASKNDGTLWTWGVNDYGQLGDGTNNDKLIPTQVGISNNWQSIAAGNRYSMAVKTDGTLFTWGKNINSQLGDGTAINKNTPTLIGCTIAGLKEFSRTENVFSLYPNPTKDIIYLENLNNQTIDKIIITDLFGRAILEKNGNVNKINVQHLQPGIYIIQLYCEQKRYQVKFIKE